MNTQCNFNISLMHFIGSKFYKFLREIVRFLVDGNNEIIAI